MCANKTPCGPDKFNIWSDQPVFTYQFQGSCNQLENQFLKEDQTLEVATYNIMNSMFKKRIVELGSVVKFICCFIICLTASKKDSTDYVVNA